MQVLSIENNVIHVLTGVEMMTKLSDLFENTDIKDHIDLDYLDLKDFDNADDLRDSIQELIHEQEIIYYHTAMDYLKEHDPSLCESNQLAADMGYSPDNLNSELLATILFQQNLSNELWTIDLDELFE